MPLMLEPAILIALALATQVVIFQLSMFIPLRLAGIRIFEVSLFGGNLFKFAGKNTTYKVGWILISSSQKPAGLIKNQDEHDSDQLDSLPADQIFYNYTLPVRSGILLMGILSHFITFFLGLVLMKQGTFTENFNLIADVLGDFLSLSAEPTHTNFQAGFPEYLAFTGLISSILNVFPLPASLMYTLFVQFGMKNFPSEGPGAVISLLIYLFFFLFLAYCGIHLLGWGPFFLFLLWLIASAFCLAAGFFLLFSIIPGLTRVPKS